MTFERAEEEQSKECRIRLMPAQERIADSFEEFLIVISCSQPFHFFCLRLAVLVRLVLDDRVIEFFLGLEISKNNGFVDACLRGEITGCCTSKPFLSKQFHCCRYDLLPTILLHK